MTPHPAFADRPPKDAVALGAFRLRMLRLADLDADMAVIAESAADLRGVMGGDWPDGLTREEDAIDLAWHEREFTARRSFAFVIGDAARDYLGCAYVTPVIGTTERVEIRFWFRSTVAGEGLAPAFRAALDAWISGPDWPRLDYVWPD